MKKLLFILGAVGLCLMGCDSDDNDKNTQKSEQTNQNEQNSGQNAQGEGANKQDEAKIDFTAFCDFLYSSDYDFSKLTAEQQTQLKKTYMDSCVSWYDGVPACRSELYFYYKCIYLDNTVEYWNAEDEKEEKCRTEHEEGPARDACIDQLYQACKELETTFVNCTNSNRDVYDKYEDQATSGDYLENLLQEWGLDIKDYQKDE